MQKINEFHHHYPTNIKGKDYICGDLQGCYTSLMNALKLLNFDESIDRLFCVGDLIDRGSESMECATLIYESWFITTQGNHEKLMWYSLLNQDESYIRCWMDNGGLWFKDEDHQLLYDIALRFKELPLVITVGEDNERFNIVHAELLRNSNDFSLFTSNNDIDNWNFTIKDMDDMLWGRQIISSRTPPMSYTLYDCPEPSIQFQTDNLSLTYCGHSIVPFRPIQIQRQIYLDTGCVNGFLPKNIKFQDRYPLTLACPKEEMFYCYTPNWNLIKYPYNKMRYYK